jgi:membrane protein YdbS with pleckstrin-like domain
MAHMTSTDRAQYERPDLAAPDRTLRVGDRRPVIAFTVLALVLLGALAFTVFAGIDNWWQALVLGVIVLVTIGLMIAVSPTRRA